MICFQRDYLEPVPGCFGQGNASFDYCIEDPNLETVIVAAQEAPPTLEPTWASTEAMTGVSDTTAVILLVEVSDITGMELGLCQGEFRGEVCSVCSCAISLHLLKVVMLRP